MTQATALGLTLGLEVPLVLLLATVLRWRPDWRRLLLVALATSLLTHPFAWHGIRGLREWIPAFWVRAAVGEVLVALIEGAMYAKLAGLGWRRGMLAGFAANGWSFGVGLVISRVGWV